MSTSILLDSWVTIPTTMAMSVYIDFCLQKSLLSCIFHIAMQFILFLSPPQPWGHDTPEPRVFHRGGRAHIRQPVCGVLSSGVPNAFPNPSVRSTGAWRDASCTGPAQ
uniref:Uncharacterized protein n=1 Tax=Eutreptiella gymnastica TaxID=73025 RepID=A0A7S4LGJ0_9EUGL|mmetsp:Transcript_13059/g.20514  ORF Transcript_13059/g.20514 Transcript_13059/m.20514 type:complete len:108 (-) Transcript_13059:773-1096(-)